MKITLPIIAMLLLAGCGKAKKPVEPPVIHCVGIYTGDPLHTEVYWDSHTGSCDIPPGPDGLPSRLHGHEVKK